MEPTMIDDRILYEDNHLIAVNKLPGELSQGDKTGDVSIIDDVKDYLKRKYDKKGNVYLGLPHRLDRPTSGVILFAKTDKALSRLSESFRKGEVDKSYYAIVLERPEKDSARLINYLVRDEKRNISVSYPREVRNSQKAVLSYRLIAQSDRYYLLDVNLETGRHHQIRSQLKAVGLHIKGDLKYGAPRSNRDGGICLHSRRISFLHPVRKEMVEIIAPLPDSDIWPVFKERFDSDLEK